MSTRATIQFRDEDELYFVYRHSDGSPENVKADIEKAITMAKGRWSDPELGTLVSFFLGLMFDAKNRLPDYELTPCFHGDESYKYYVTWCGKEKRWLVEIED